MADQDSTRKRLRQIFCGIKYRCENPKAIKYNIYGGKGITVCREWRRKRSGFQAFIVWALTNGYAPNLSIDRIDSNGNYEPSNCRWVTPHENSSNTGSRRLTDDDVRRMVEDAKSEPVSVVADRYRVTVKTLTEILKGRGRVHATGIQRRSQVEPCGDVHRDPESRRRLTCNRGLRHRGDHQFVADGVFVSWPRKTSTGSLAESRR